MTSTSRTLAEQGAPQAGVEGEGGSRPSHPCVLDGKGRGRDLKNGALEVANLVDLSVISFVPEIKRYLGAAMSSRRS